MKGPLLHFCLALIIFLGAFSFYGFWYSAVSSKSSAVASLESRIAGKTETAARLNSARMALSELAGDETVVRNYFVSESEVVAFISDLEERGKAQGTSLTILSVSNVTGEAHPALLIALNLKGSFDSIMRTVGAIEYAPYDIKVLGLSLGLDEKNAWHAELSINVGLIPATVAKP